MKKFIGLLLMLVCTTTMRAAIVKWFAGGESVTDSYIGGTAYLIEMKADGTDLDGMISHIKNVGLVRPSDATGDFISKVEIDDYREAYVPRLDDVTENATSTYYVLFVDKMREEFVFSNPSKVEEWSAPPSASGEKSYTVNFIEDGSEWAANGGSVGNVPEPTVLALLALGVAGVALRRKKVVA